MQAETGRESRENECVVEREERAARLKHTLQTRSVTSACATSLAYPSGSCKAKANFALNYARRSLHSPPLPLFPLFPLFPLSSCKCVLATPRAGIDDAQNFGALNGGSRRVCHKNLSGLCVGQATKQPPTTTGRASECGIKYKNV